MMRTEWIHRVHAHVSTDLAPVDASCCGLLQSRRATKNQDSSGANRVERTERSEIACRTQHAVQRRRALANSREAQRAETEVEVLAAAGAFGRAGAEAKVSRQRARRVRAAASNN